jgi:hypothetical protein
MESDLHTGRVVVADTEPSSVWGRKDGRSGAAKLNCASDLHSVFPHDLGEVTVFLKVGEIGVGLAVELGREPTDLIVVPHVGDVAGEHLTWVQVDFIWIGGARFSNVLTVTSGWSNAPILCE